MKFEIEIKIFIILEIIILEIKIFIIQLIY